MLVSIKATDDLVIYSSQKLPSEFILCENLEQNSYTLGKATDVREGQRAIITGVSYIVNKKHYALHGWGIEAYIDEKGVISPLLRPAQGDEKNIFQVAIREPRKVVRYEGDKNAWWPKVVSLPILQQVKVEEFTETILEQVNELESEDENIEEIED